MDAQEFASPPASCRPVTLWMLNDRLEPEEIDRQLRGFAEAGWGAVITRTFDGLATEYLSEEWFAVLERILATAGEVGLRVWLQAGYMPNGIPHLPAEHEMTVLAARPADEPPADGETVLAKDRQRAYVTRRLGNVLDLLNGEAVRSYLQQAYAEPYLDRLGEHFGRTIEAVWVDEPSLQPPRIPWGERIERELADRWNLEPAAAVPLLFGRSDPAPGATATDGGARYVRHAYWRTVVELLTGGYFAEVSAWCEAHDLKFAGHLMGEDTLFSQIAWTAAAMPAYPHMQMPGIDHLTRSLRWTHGAMAAPGEAPHFLLTPKQCSSVANQAGGKLALAEMYGVSSQGLTFEQRKRIADYFAILGINCRCIHGSFYSLRGRRKRIYAPHLSHQQPWWPENRAAADPLARVSCALRQGRYRADVLVIHPMDSAFCVYDPLAYRFTRPDRVPEDIRELNDTLATLSENLLGIQRGFEYADEGMLAERGRLADGEIAVGEMTYRAVVLPSLVTLRPETVRLLDAFVTGGGTVLSVGRAPTRLGGEPSDDVRRFMQKVRRVPNRAPALAEALAAAAPADVWLTGRAGPVEMVWLHERRDDDGERTIFLANVSETETVALDLHIRPDCELTRWGLDDGRAAPLPHRAEDGEAVAPLTLPPAGSALIVARPGRPAVEVAAENTPAEHAISLDGTWEIERHDPNALTLDVCRFRRGDGPESAPLPVIAVQEILTDADYRGPVSLRYEFAAGHVPDRVALAVEQPQACRITLNGEPVGEPEGHYVDRAFQCIDVAGRVVEGANTVELRRDFEPVGRPTIPHGGRFQDLGGVELESIYVVGDFAVAGHVSSGLPRPGCVRYAPDFALAPEARETPGDLLAAGLPFYAGRVTLGRTVRIDQALPAGQRALLRLSELHAAVARVRINGRDVGPLAWRPYELDVTDAIQPGENRIEIDVVNTLRNLLGPHHRPSGEPDFTWGHDSYSGRYALDTHRAYPQWWQGRDEPSDAWTDDCFLLPFGLAPGTELCILQRREG